LPRWIVEFGSKLRHILRKRTRIMHFIVFHKLYDGLLIQRLQSGNGIAGLIAKKWSF